MQYRILNKTTNEDKIYEIDLNYLLDGQTELELLNLYVAGDDPFGVAAYNNYVVLPLDGKAYITSDIEPFYQINSEKLFSELTTNILLAIDKLRKTPFPVVITDINNVQGSYYLNLEDTTILKLLVLLKKAEILGQASDEFINANTGTPEYKTFSLQAIQEVQVAVIQKDDFFKIKLNQVRNVQTLEELQTIEQEFINV